MNEFGKFNEKYNRAIDELLRQSLAFKNSERYLKFVNFLMKFRKYSCFNNMLVYIQNPNITLFGNPNFWLKNGRIVKPDAKPYIILVPHGPVGFVFDVFDTVGRETPQEFINKGIGFQPFEVKGEISQSEFERVINRIKIWEIDVNYENLSYLQGGYVRNSFFNNKFEISLNKDLTYMENFSILLHELAHIFLGHTIRDKIFKRNDKETYISLPRRKNLTERIVELEAETVSYLLCARKGLKTRSVEYLSGYIRSELDLKAVSYEMIARATDKIERLFL